MNPSVPPRPVPEESELSSGSPFVLSSYRTYSIGWQRWSERKGGPQYVTLRRSVGLYRVLNKYPLDDEGWERAWRELESLDRDAASAARARLAARAAVPPEPGPEPVTELPVVRKDPWSVRLANTFTGLGVCVRNGEVYPFPILGRPSLGPIRGARAELTDPTKAHRVRAAYLSGLTLGPVLGPLALAPGLFRRDKAVAFVVFPDGTYRERALDGGTAIRQAQADAVKFNALAGAANPDQPPPAEPAQGTPSPSPSPADRLAQLNRLHENGLITDEEYRAKRAEIIDQL